MAGFASAIKNRAGQIDKFVDDATGYQAPPPKVPVTKKKGVKKKMSPGANKLLQDFMRDVRAAK